MNPDPNIIEVIARMTNNDESSFWLIKNLISVGIITK